MIRIKPLLKKLTLLLMGCVAGLVMAELGLRILGVSYPLPYAPDPHCGARRGPRS